MGSWSRTPIGGVAAAAGIASAIVAAIMPTIGTWHRDPQSALLDHTRTTSSGRARRRLLGALVVAETTFTMVLLVGAGLVIRNFVRLQTDRLGFETRGLLTPGLVPPAAHYPPGPARARLVRATSAAVVIAVTTAMACLIPALTVSRLDVAASLRAE